MKKKKTHDRLSVMPPPAINTPGRRLRVVKEKNRGTQEAKNTTEKNATEKNAPPPSTCMGSTEKRKIVNEQAQDQVINDKEDTGGIL